MSPRSSDGPSRPSALAPLALLVALGVGMGCSLDSNFGDLGEKLLDPDVQGLDTPGQRLITGPYFDLAIVADEAGARYALARNPDSELAIIDFARETHCRVQGVLRYGSVLLAPGQPALIPVLLGDEGESTRLGFTDFSCQRLSYEIPSSGLPLQAVESSAAGVSLLLRTEAHGLVLVDPWTRSEREIARSVRPRIDPVRAFGHFMWVDRGVITISDPELTPLGYIGNDVVEVAVSAEDSEIAFVEAAADAAGAGRLFTAKALADVTPREVASDACSVRYLTVGGRRQLAYLSPCGERRLVFQDRATGALRVIDEDVSGDPVVRTISGETFLTYVKNPDPDASSGTLWLIRGDSAPVAIAENARTRPSGVSPTGGLLTMLDWTSTGGRLVEWKDDVVRDIASNVIELGTVGALAGDVLTFLANFDGATGDLMRLNDDLSTEVLATRVPLRAAEGDAFLTNFDGGSGDLMLLNRTDGSSRLLASGVARGSFGFAQQFSGVIMLSDRDSETSTSTLRLHLLGSERQFVVNSGVTETREVAFPNPGLLYNVAIGEQSGVWYSKAL